MYLCVLNADQHSLAGGTAAICGTCFQQSFSELAYQYRMDIPQDKLPGSYFSDRLQLSIFLKPYRPHDMGRG